jgi:hypothetical protein
MTTKKKITKIKDECDFRKRNGHCKMLENDDFCDTCLGDKSPTGNNARWGLQEYEGK